MGHLYQRGKKGVYWVKYYRDGRAFYESSGSTKEQAARRLLRLREGDIERGLPVTPKMGRLRFEEGAADLVTEYRVNGRKSLAQVEALIENHLKPAFGGRRLATLTTPEIRAYVDTRQQAGAKNATINRELAALKRIYSLAVKAGKLLSRPAIELLEERNTRAGFFESDQFRAVQRRLPEALRPVAEFAYLTGWRINSEVLPLTWSRVDRVACTVRLDPETTKNRAGRLFRYGHLSALKAVVEARWEAHEVLRKQGTIVPWVFFRMAGPKDEKKPRRIVYFRRSWITACTAAGCPGKIPHDFRRTAVRNLVRAGVSEKVAMTMTGHRTRSVFDRYDIVSEGDLDAAAAKLDQALAGAGGDTDGDTEAHGPETAASGRPLSAVL